MYSELLLPITLFAPLIAVGVLLFIGDEQHTLIRRISAASTFISLIGAVIALVTYDPAVGGYQHTVKYPWIASLGIHFHLGVDGISVVLVMLHALCAFTGTLISSAIRERVKEYYIFYLSLITGVFGVFTSLDIFFFYFFYEMAVIPMFPLVGIWGSDIKEKGVVRYSKDYATMKLTLYLSLGAVLALAGIIWFYFACGLRTFDLPTLERYVLAHPLPENLQLWIFPMLAVGFGVIAPLWPFHSWSPLGHSAAPSAVSMLHAGVLMKLGSYAILRIAMTLMPAGAQFWLPWIAVLCVMNIVYGGFVAMAQKDLKLIIGYSSSSHMGYVLLGLACLTPLALSGAVLLMFAHGLMTALAFALIGHIYDQTHTKYLPDLGGLGRRIPFIAVCSMFAAMASSGLPGFPNFISELMVFVGGWDIYPFQVACGIFGIVVTSVYMLRFIRGVFFGPPKPELHVVDAQSFSQRFPYVLLIAVLLYVGCWPKPILRIINAGARPLIERIAPTGNTYAQPPIHLSQNSKPVNAYLEERKQ